MEKRNPWQQVPLDAYEGHMSWTDVHQLQCLNGLMKEQWQADPCAKKAAILGVAGGNGLEHCGGQIETVYGIDINKEYLEACRRRYGEILGPRLVLLEMDVSQPQAVLPQVDLLIADLVIEYIGVPVFCEKAAASQAAYISCVIQLPYHGGFVSDSPYQAELGKIGELHRDIDPGALRNGLAGFGYAEVLRNSVRLPNGKELLRVDYRAVKEGRKNGIHNYTK